MLLVGALVALGLASALALGWCGWRVDLGLLRMSIRGPRNPIFLALLASVLAWMLAPAGQRAVTLIGDWRAMARPVARLLAWIAEWLRGNERRIATAVGAVAALAIVVTGLTRGAPVAGGSDSYGYVSQAHLWATGRLHDELPLVRELVPTVPARALLPLGYILAADGESMVPVYSPGLPMVMAVFERLAGRRAVFWVVPLLGGLAVWSTYLLGRRGARPVAGALAAILLATSPAFLLQLNAAPMSEVPATAWWALALALLFSESAWAASGSGLAVGLAILTRPNLVPLALVPGVLLLWRALHSPPHRRRLLLFSAPVVASCLVVAALNNSLYGSPLASGYDVRGLFGLEHPLPNLARYPVLLSEMQTPAIWLAAIAPWLAWRRFPRERARDRACAQDRAVADPRAVTLVEAAFILAVLACYLFYPAFDASYTLRFLVPALPALFALLAYTLVPSSLERWPWWRVLAGLLIAVVVARHGFAWARAHSAFDTSGE